MLATTQVLVWPSHLLCEVVKMTGWSGLCSKKIILAGHSLEAQDEAKYLAEWSFSQAVCYKENIAKARTTSSLGGMGKVGAFQGSFNPLSGLSIFETCVMCSVLLYGCETCILDHPCLMHGSGEFPSWNWQTHASSTIIPCHHANDEAVRVGLQWPSVASHILICKLMYLSMLTTKSDSQASAKLFSSPATENIFQISILQQHEILEKLLRTSVLAHCLSHLHDVPRTVRERHVSL